MGILEEAKKFDACAGTVALAIAKTALPCPRQPGKFVRNRSNGAIGDQDEAHALFCRPGDARDPFRSGS